jgi:hypothetical protein
MMDLADISRLANIMLALEHEVEQDEKDLSAKKERVRILKEESIPMAMNELEMLSFKLTSGETLTISQEVYASIPAASKEAVYAWLAERGYDGIIKTSIEAQFDKGEMENAMTTLELLAANGVNASLSKGIHAGTLKAFLKEQMEAGTEIPLDLFGARPTWTTKIKTPKLKEK